MKKQRVKVSDIYVGARRRPNINPDTVRTIAASIKEIGLQNPISICFHNDFEIDGETFDNVAVLVAGAHRREALLSLGPQFEWVDAIVFDDERKAAMWEISENLHRAELDRQQRAEQETEWMALATGGGKGEHGVQVPSAGGRGNEGGISLAARDLPIPGSTENAKRVHLSRSKTIAEKTTEEAKQAAREAGLSNSTTALLEIARTEPEKQVEKVREIAERKAAPKPPKPELAPAPASHTVVEAMAGAKEAYFAKLDAMKLALHREWQAGPEDWQEEYLRRPHPTGGKP